MGDDVDDLGRELTEGAEALLRILYADQERRFVENPGHDAHALPNAERLKVIELHIILQHARAINKLAEKFERRSVEIRSKTPKKPTTTNWMD